MSDAGVTGGVTGGVTAGPDAATYGPAVAAPADADPHAAAAEGG